MNRRRVILVVESGTDVRLVEGLAERFELELLCRRIVHGVEISRSPKNSIPISVGPSSRFFFAGWMLWQLFRKRAHWDIVIVQGYALAALGCNAFGRCFAKHVVMLICSPVERYYRCRKTSPRHHPGFRGAEYLLLWSLARLNARLGQQYFALSGYLRSVVETHGGRLPVHVIPVYGVDVTIYRPSTLARTAIRAACGLPNDRKLIFFSSRVAPEKDVDTLLRAARLLREQGYKVLVVNRSGGFKTFAKLAAELDVSELVDAGDAVDPQTELAVLYQAADLCVQASRDEGLGFSPLEALACGTPVVATAVGGLLETIVDGVTGWNYTLGDSKQLAEAIRSALENTEEAQARTARGRARVIQEYERSKVFAAFEATILRILACVQ